MATVCFEVECTTVPGELVAVCGSSEALGSWTVEKSLQLDASDYPVWKGRILVEQPAEFKYLIAKKPEQNLQLVRWEGDFKNRTLETIQGQQLLRHRFGDASYDPWHHVGDESKEIVVEETAAAARPAALDGDASPTRPQLPAAALSPVGRQASGILKDITVDPAVRLTRLVRASSTTSFEDSYELRAGEILGTGMSGGVVVGKNKKTGAEVAIKTLPLNMNKEPGSALTRCQEHIKAEIQHQLAMDHPNICRLLEVYEEPTRLLLVMEKLNGPDLFDAFSKKSHGFISTRRYTETDAVDIVRQILSAVAYCHRNGVCHRDLKLENFCLEDDSENARIKMIDFGLAHSIDDFPMTDSCGTLYYAAPEVLRGTARGGGEYDISDADITNFYNSLLTGAGGDPPKGTVLSELIVDTRDGTSQFSMQDIAVGVAKLKEQMANPMFVTKGGVGYGVDETQQLRCNSVDMLKCQ
eukprot:g32819.t1